MNSLLQRLLTGTNTPALTGGLALPGNKRGLPTGNSIDSLSIPDTVYIALINYRRETLQPYVQPNESVQRGDSLADGVIAPCDGQVVSITPRPVIHPSGLSVPCAVIKTIPAYPVTAAVHAPLDVLTLDRIAQCGIQGLGGAGFATAEKLMSTGLKNGSINTLIINAVECEPVISCDEALMMIEARPVVLAIQALIDLTGCRRCILAIEDNKHKALRELQCALELHPSTHTIELKLLPPIYPSGAERPLIQRLTGKTIPANVAPAQMGVVCINVATALAVEQARQGVPMTSRVVTIAGQRARHACNVRITFGTTVSEVLKQTGNWPLSSDTRVRAGGPLSGFDLLDLDVPVTATTNCITLDVVGNSVVSEPCIRCNACSDVCPVELLPQQLHWHASQDDQHGCGRYRLMDCIECGCCDAVCPSNIALTQTFRYAKGLLREDQLKLQLAAEAQTRFQHRKQRLAEREAAREQKRLAARARLAERVDPISDALSRVRKRRNPDVSQHSDMPGLSAPKNKNATQDKENPSS